jgi:hypothetical protein
MTPKDKAISLVDSYRIVLMNQDTECGEEILCTGIAKRCALIAVDEILNNDGFTQFDIYLTEYWQQVKQEIQAI